MESEGGERSVEVDVDGAVEGRVELEGGHGHVEILEGSGG